MTVLLTLHIDIRCGVIHMVERSLHGKYLLDQPTNEADSSVLSLNADLVSFDENISGYLRERERTFITAGLGLLLDQLLVTNASHIKAMNANGCGRMQLNILVLQQNLKNIEGDVALVRSAQFFELFNQGPDTIVAKAKETRGKDLGFSYEELKVLVELCYSEGVNSSRREVAVAAKRALSDRLLALSEHMWQT
jgi:exocyst complex component 4